MGKTHHAINRVFENDDGLAHVHAKLTAAETSKVAKDKGLLAVTPYFKAVGDAVGFEYHVEIAGLEHLPQHFQLLWLVALLSTHGARPVLREEASGEGGGS